MIETLFLRYYEMREKDVLKFGYSTREYVLLHEKTDTSEVHVSSSEDEVTDDEEWNLFFDPVL